MQMTLSINPRGTITLPVKMRQLMGLKPDDLLLVQATDEGILLRPTVTLPVEMYSAARLAEFAEQEALLNAVLLKVEPSKNISAKPSTLEA